MISMIAMRRLVVTVACLAAGSATAWSQSGPPDSRPGGPPDRSAAAAAAASPIVIDEGAVASAIEADRCIGWSEGLAAFVCTARGSDEGEGMDSIYLDRIGVGREGTRTLAELGECHRHSGMCRSTGADARAYPSVKAMTQAWVKAHVDLLKRWRLRPSYEAPFGTKACVLPQLTLLRSRRGGLTAVTDEGGGGSVRGAVPDDRCRTFAPLECGSDPTDSVGYVRWHGKPDGRCELIGDDLADVTRVTAFLLPGREAPTASLPRAAQSATHGAGATSQDTSLRPITCRQLVACCESLARESAGLAEQCQAMSTHIDALLQGEGGISVAHSTCRRMLERFGKGAAAPPACRLEAGRATRTTRLTADAPHSAPPRNRLK